jgi:hypothetical protein
MADETRSATYLARFRPSVKLAGERAAKDQNRSLNSLLETLLIDHLRQQGYLPSIGKTAGAAGRKK